MKRLKSSIIAWSFLAHGLAFAVLYLVTPDDIMKYMGYALVLGAGIAALWRWFKDFLYNFRQGTTGANFLVVGAFALMLMVFLHRVVVVGDASFPEYWLFKSEILIRCTVWFLGWALALLYFAPDISGGGIPSRSYIALAAGIAAASFLMGYSVAMSVADIAASPLIENGDMPSCPLDRPVWGSSTGVYHIQKSPYRGMVEARKCFKDTDEAKRKGFRAPAN